LAATVCVANTSVSLFLRDAGIEFKDIRHSYGTWSAESEKFKEQGITRTGKLPALIINGTILNQVSPLNRQPIPLKYRRRETH
jgi:glutathione S-transferase